MGSQDSNRRFYSSVRLQLCPNFSHSKALNTELQTQAAAKKSAVKVARVMIGSVKMST